MTKEEMQRLISEVKANLARINNCARHRFDGGAPAPAQKKICLVCGGDMNLPDISLYVKGYIAAGGDPCDIWPEYGSGLKRERLDA